MSSMLWEERTHLAKQCVDRRAATEMCDLLSEESRRDCYASVGVDMERVDEYLGRTLALEAALKGMRCAIISGMFRHCFCAVRQCTACCLSALHSLASQVASDNQRSQRMKVHACVQLHSGWSKSRTASWCKHHLGTRACPSRHHCPCRDCRSCRPRSRCSLRPPRNRSGAWPTCVP